MPPVHKRIVRGYGLIEELKEHRPDKWIAYDEDGEVLSKGHVPDVRNRHSRVLIALESLEWETVDLLDKKDGLLKRHHRNADDRLPAGDIEALVPSRDVAQTAGMLSLFLKAQDMALSRNQQSIDALLNAHYKLVDSAVKRLEVAEARASRVEQANLQLSGQLVAAQLQQQFGEALANALPDDGEAGTLTSSVLGEVMPQLITEALSKRKSNAGERDASERKPAKPAPSSRSNGVNGHRSPSESGETP